MRSSLLIAVATLVAAAAVARADQTRRYRIEGHDLARGPFSGALELREDARGRLWLERQVQYVDGTEEVLRGPAQRRGRLVRARLHGAVGAVGRLAGATAAPVWLQLELDPSGRCRSECREGGAARSRDVGRLVGDDLGVEGLDPTRAKKDPPPPGARSARQVVDAEGRPSLEGTRAEGYTVFDGVPFVRGEGDERQIDPNDVKQQGLAHCYFGGALIAIAKTDPEWLRAAITTLPDGRFSVVFRRVHAGGRDARLSIDRALPYKTKGETKVAAFFPLLDEVTSTLLDPWDPAVRHEVVHYELWPQLVEKAWALHKGGYEAMEWSRASVVFDAISGIPSRTYHTRDMSAEEIERVLRAAQTVGHPTALGSKQSTGEVGMEVNLIGLHTYVLWDLDGEGRAKLYNAWASSHPARALSGAEIKQAFTRIYVGQF